MIYLDHNATAAPLPEAAQAAAAWLAGPPANPSSVHAAGRRARAAVERARRAVAAALGASPGEIVFTSGATEALHQAVADRVAPGQHVVASAVEHPALFGALERRGARITRVPVDGAGRLRVEDVVAALEPGTALVAVMAAQNEIGTLYPVRVVAAAVAPVPLLCDAVQAFGKVPLDVRALGCAAAVVSGHKIGAPPGAGALWTPAGRAPRALLAGGPQERGHRAGTENVPAIVGFGVAAEHLPQRLDAMAAVAARVDRLRAGLSGVPGVRFHGAPGLPNTLAFRVEGVAGEALLQAFDLEGVCLSSGSACSAGGLDPSPVLLALGLDAATARGGLRASLGPETTDADIERVLTLFPQLVTRARAAAEDGRACA